MKIHKDVAVKVPKEVAVKVPKEVAVKVPKENAVKVKVGNAKLSAADALYLNSSFRQRAADAFANAPAARRLDLAQPHLGCTKPGRHLEGEVRTNLPHAPARHSDNGSMAGTVGVQGWSASSFIGGAGRLDGGVRPSWLGNGAQVLGGISAIAAGHAGGIQQCEGGLRDGKVPDKLGARGFAELARDLKQEHAKPAPEHHPRRKKAVDE